MIRFALGLVPVWGWALLLGIAGATLYTRHLKEVQDARNEVIAEWNAEKLVAAETYRLRNQANAGVIDGYRKQVQSVARAAASARTESVRLRDEIAYHAQRAASGPGADDSPIGKLFGECAAEVARLAEAADQLAAQTRGLQRYAGEVCQLGVDGNR